MSINKNIDLDKFAEFVLRQMYFAEFEIIDGLSQHPSGLSFDEWLVKNDLLEF